MKKFAAFLMIVSVSCFSFVGCKPAEEVKDTEPAADAPADADADADAPADADADKPADADADAPAPE
jgi:hypothetical protein